MKNPSNEFSVVLVCTGNRFRSPLAEQLLRAATTGIATTRISSVGTLDLPSGPALPEAIELGRELGVDLSRHRSRPLREERLQDADLVLGFERRHIARAVVDGGADRERVFTVGELAGLLRVVAPRSGGDPASSARAAIAEASSVRAQLRHPQAAELADPFGGGPADFRRAATEVQAAVDAIALRLFGLEA